MVSFNLVICNTVHCNKTATRLQHTATRYKSQLCSPVTYSKCRKRLTCKNVYLVDFKIHLHACCEISCHTATHCNTLQHNATQCNTLQQTLSTLKYLSVPAPRHPATLQRTATLQHTTTRCNKPRRVLKYISMTALRYPATLQHTATHCNTLQHAATHLVDFKIHLHARFEASCYGCHVIFLATLPADEIEVVHIEVVHIGVRHISTQARLALAEIQSNIYSFQR